MVDSDLKLQIAYEKEARKRAKEQARALKQEQRLVKAEISQSKQEVASKKFDINQKQKESKKIASFAKRYLTSKIVNKPILKSSQATLTIEEREVPSVLGDENRFFKGNYEKEKRSMFFE